MARFAASISLRRRPSSSAVSPSTPAFTTRAFKRIMCMTSDLIASSDIHPLRMCKVKRRKIADALSHAREERLRWFVEYPSFRFCSSLSCWACRRARRSMRRRRLRRGVPRHRFEPVKAQIDPIEPAAHRCSPIRAAVRSARAARPPWRRRLAWAVALAVALAALFLLSLSQSRSSALSSDGASNILQAQAMLHGNPLLRGWWTSDVSFYTMDRRRRQVFPRPVPDRLAGDQSAFPLPLF